MEPAHRRGIIDLHSEAIAAALAIHNPRDYPSDVIVLASVVARSTTAMRLILAFLSEGAAACSADTCAKLLLNPHDNYSLTRLPWEAQQAFQLPNPVVLLANLRGRVQLRSCQLVD